MRRSRPAHEAERRAGQRHGRVGAARCVADVHLGSFLQLDSSGGSTTAMDDTRTSSISRIRIDDVGFDKVTMRETVDRIVAMARMKDRARYVCTGNLDHLVIVDKDQEFRSVYENADLVVADGAP